MSNNVIYGLHLLDGDQTIRYVGLTTNGAAKRFTGHLYNALVRDSSLPVAQWIRKHEGNVTFTVLEDVGDLPFPGVLGAREVVWIEDLQTYSARSGLNLTTGGEGRSGHALSVSHRESISKVHKGKIVSAETREKQSSSHIGLVYGPCSDETKSKISVANTGRKRTEEQKIRISQASKKHAGIGTHVRWHHNRDLVNPDCHWCVEDPANL